MIDEFLLKLGQQCFMDVIRMEIFFLQGCKIELKGNLKIRSR